jgi:vitamin K-dependent gamma-carboxylase
MGMFYQLLFKKVDNSPVVLFRIFFGTLMAIESWGAILTSWVKDTLVTPSYTFTFIGFEFLSPLIGEYMYVHYILMGFFGLMMAFGWRYKLNAFLFALFWSITYFIQKTQYNNHYYLIFLVAWLMYIIPANNYCSLDVKQKRVEEKQYVYNWVNLIFIFQVGIVYFFATIAKIYPDWLNGKFISIMMDGSAYWFEKNLNIQALIQLFKNHNFHLFLAYSGIVFDALILPAMLWNKTRKWAFISALFFHLFNSATLHIGIFPYFALSLCLFCFDKESIQKRFFKNKTFFNELQVQNISCKQKNVAAFFLIFLTIQSFLPLRHWLIPGDVLWTEEGHRLSWRMMLRSRTGKTDFYVRNNETKFVEKINFNDYLTEDQISDFQSKPDMIWQFAQHLKQHYHKKGISDLGIFVESQVSINGGEMRPYIDSEIDLANVKWSYFGHQKWILD